MAEFFQTYGTWIILGVGFLLMMAMHGGHGAGHGQHASGDGPRGSDSQSAGNGASSEDSGQAKHAGRCH